MIGGCQQPQAVTQTGKCI